MSNQPLPIAVLISGGGTNLQAIIDQWQANRLPVDIRIVISSKSKAFGRKRAQKANIKETVLKPKDFGTREAYDQALIDILEKEGVELVVLAGFMRILTEGFVKHFRHRIINLHPALLPSFPGVDGIEQAWNYGVRTTGVTVHFVDSGVDTGPIILQSPIEIKADDTLETLAERIHQEEHRLLPEAVRLYAQGRLQIEGRKVQILPPIGS